MDGVSPENLLKKKPKKPKKRKKDKTSRIRVLGVESVNKRKALDNFGHLEDSDTNLQAQGFDEFTNYMKKMGVKIAYQKETYGKALKSNLKPRLGAKKRGLNVKWNLDGLEVKDETNAKKLSQKEAPKEAVKESSAGEDSKLTLTQNSKTDGNPDTEDDDTTNEPSTGLPNIKIGIDLKTIAMLLTDDHLATVTNLESVVNDNFGTVRKLKKNNLIGQAASPTPLSKAEKQKLKVKQEIRAMTSTEVNPDFVKNHDSDEEVEKMKKIAKKKDEVFHREKDQITELLAQQFIVRDYKKDLDSKKNFFVEIAPKQKSDKKKPAYNDPSETIEKMVQNYERIHGKEPVVESSPTRRSGAHKRKKSAYEIRRD